MRYIFSILLIAVVFTIITGSYIFQKKGPEPEPGLVINDRVISTGEFAELYRIRSHDQEDRQQFIESLITRELLIQEARKMGIDQNEVFRHSIQNFYEQSLTKILLERKYDALKYTPSRQEIDRFLELQDYQVEMTLLPVSDQAGKEEKYEGPFRNLATSMQVAIILVTVGEVSEPILLDEQEYMLRLDNLSTIPAEDGLGMPPEKARQIIAHDRQEQSLAKWLYGLRKQAVIKVSASIRKEKSTRNLVQKRSVL